MAEPKISDLDNLAKQMVAVDSGLQIRDHVYYFTLYPNCVTGKAISEWLIRKGFCDNKIQSTTVGSQLVDKKLLIPLTKSSKFAPETNLFFRFQVDQEKSQKISARWNLTHDSEPREQAKKILQALKEPKTGLHLKDRSYLFYKFPACFDGKSLVTWLVDHSYFKTRKEAAEFGIYLLNEDLIYHVTRDKPFSDSGSYYYRFKDQPLSNLEELRNISEKQLTKIETQLKSPNNGIKPKNLTYYFTTWQKVFWGSDLVKWLMDHAGDFVKSEQSAIDLADKLLTEKFISVVPSTLRIPKFTSHEVLYRFTTDPQQIKVIEGNKELEMTQLYEQMKSGISLEEHRSGLRVIKRCFKGSTIVAWMLESGPVSDRKSAIHYIDMAWREGFFRSTSDHDFHDSDELFYKFKKKKSSSQIKSSSERIEENMSSGNLLSESRTFDDSSDDEDEKDKDKKKPRGLQKGFQSFRKSVNNLFAEDQSKKKSFEIQMEWYCPVGGDRCVRLPRDEVTRLRRTESFNKNNNQTNQTIVVDSPSTQKTIEEPPAEKPLEPPTPEMEEALEILNNGGYGSEFSSESWVFLEIRKAWSLSKLTDSIKRNRKLLDDLEGFNESRGLNARALKHPEMTKQVIVIQDKEDIQTLSKRQKQMKKVKTKWESTFVEDDIPLDDFLKLLNSNHCYNLESEKGMTLRSKLKPAKGKKVQFKEGRDIAKEFPISPYYGSQQLDENGKHIIPGAVSKFLAQEAVDSTSISQLPKEKIKLIYDEIVEAFESTRVSVPIHVNGKKHHEDEMLVTQFIDNQSYPVIVEYLSQFIDSDDIIKQKEGWQSNVQDIVERALTHGVRALFDK